MPSTKRTPTKRSAPGNKRRHISKSLPVGDTGQPDGGDALRKTAVTSRRHKAQLLELPKRAITVGRVLVCGAGDTGQLGLGPDVFEKPRPAALSAVENVVDICCGGMHSLVLDNNGNVFSFGCNDEGALGRDTTEEGAETVPGKVALPGKVIKMSAGDSHSAFLLEDGRLYACGSFRDSHGNMGMTPDGNKRSPAYLLAGITCVEIGSGNDHLAVLSDTGKLYTIGCGEQGQLGRVSKRTASGEGRRGKLDMLKFQEVVALRCKRFIALWTSNYCTFVREDQTNKIFGFGLNNYKQLAQPSVADQLVTVPRQTEFVDVKKLCGGGHHTVCLNTSGQVYIIGRRDYGRLGLGKLENDVEKLTLLQGFGNNDEKVIDVFSGEATSFAITEANKLYGWGLNTTNQLGNGTEEDAITPELITVRNHTILKVTSGGQHTLFLAKRNDDAAASVGAAATTAVATVVAAVAVAAAAASTTESNEQPPQQKSDDDNKNNANFNGPSTENIVESTTNSDSQTSAPAPTISAAEAMDTTESSSSDGLVVSTTTNSLHDNVVKAKASSSVKATVPAAATASATATAMDTDQEAKDDDDDDECVEVAPKNVVWPSAEAEAKTHDDVGALQKNNGNDAEAEVDGDDDADEQPPSKRNKDCV